MALVTDHIIADGFSFLLLIAMLTFLWFHPWHRRSMAEGRAEASSSQKQKQDNTPVIRKQAA